MAFLKLNNNKKEMSVAMLLFYLVVVFWTSDVSTAFVTMPRNVAMKSASLLFSQSQPPQQKEEDGSSLLEETRQRLDQMNNDIINNNEEDDEDELYKQYLKYPAIKLKEMCKEQNLPVKGRKPDLAKRLIQKLQEQENGDDDDDDTKTSSASTVIPALEVKDGVKISDAEFTGWPSNANFALSKAARTALARASFTTGTPIQEGAWEHILEGDDVLLHAPTGSGKTLAYLLPLTEQLWNDYNNNNNGEDDGVMVILTPTRELAAQVAGIATVLAPPGTVRFITTPCNINDRNRMGSEDDEFGGRSTAHTDAVPRIYVSSAKSMLMSLVGKQDGSAAPTPKPAAQQFIQSVSHVVLDEVDHLLFSGSQKYKNKNKKHEKPAAILVSMIARYTLSEAQIISASATVGRPMRRELARVLGLAPKDGPILIRGQSDSNNDNGDNDMSTTRAVKIPSTVNHYVIPASDEDTGSGSMLTCAAKIATTLIKHKKNGDNGNMKILLVISKTFGMAIHHVMGALTHFSLQPKSVLDEMKIHELQNMDQMMESHRRVAGVVGLGVSPTSITTTKDDDNNQSLWVVPEQSIRGLHMEDVNVVIVVGRPSSPDEYLHIAGRTGRAGKSGVVLSITSYAQASALNSWESMLDVSFIPLSEDDEESWAEELNL